MERFPAQQEERAEAGKLFEELVAAGPGRARDADRRTRHALVFYNYILAIDPDGFARPHERDGLRGLRGRGHPGRGPVPVDEPLRAVPALALPPAGLRGVRRPARSAADVVPGRRGRRAARIGLLHGERLPRRDDGVEDAVEASRRSNGTPTSCRTADRAGGTSISRGRTAAGGARSPSSNASSNGRARVVVADERVGHERLQRIPPVAGHRRLDRQELVRLGVLHQPEHLRRERIDRGADARRRGRRAPRPPPPRRRAGSGWRRRSARSRPGCRSCPRAATRRARPPRRCRTRRLVPRAAWASCRASDPCTARSARPRSP